MCKSSFWMFALNEEMQETKYSQQAVQENTVLEANQQGQLQSEHKTKLVSFYWDHIQDSDVII